MLTSHRPGEHPSFKKQNRRREHRRKEIRRLKRIGGDGVTGGGERGLLSGLSSGKRFKFSKREIRTESGGPKGERGSVKKGGAIRDS